MFDQAFSIRFPRFVVIIALAGALAAAPDAQAVVLKSQLPCQKAVSKAGRLYATTTLKIKAACDFDAFGNPGTNPCSDQKVTDALAAAATKLDETITKSCGTMTSEQLSEPRPAGLSLAPLAALFPALRSEIDRLVDDLIDSLHTASSAGGGAAPSDAALHCQSALDAALRKGLLISFKKLGSSCQDREDAGKTVTGETSHIVEACIALTQLELDAASTKIVDKVAGSCDATAIAELGACPSVAADRTAASVSGCLLREARAAGAAVVISLTHLGVSGRVIGRIEINVPGSMTAKVGASSVHAVVRNEQHQIIGQMVSDAYGRIDVGVRPLQRVEICLSRGGVISCSPELVDVGLGPVYFGDRALDFPLGANEQVVTGRVRRVDASPCFEASTVADFALRGGVVVSPTGQPASGERTPVSPTGDFVVAVPLSGAQTLHADCGTENVSVDLGSPPLSTSPVIIDTTNDLPSGGTVDMTDDQGQPVTDPSTVDAGDVVTLHASFTDDDPLEYRWEITRGNGKFVGGALADDRRASGAQVDWQMGSDSNMQQVNLWASDAKGGIETLVATIGPINIGPITSPCIGPVKLQKFLCGLGYTAGVPTPSGGLSDFLSYKYRNPSRNSAGDACLYYNLVDPDCIDMNCDGIVDAGTDPMGKCKRMTLGGWWQKNGFSTTGLGPDVVSAWYLNSNDLGFGREMHCRVTSWSSIIAERPIEARTSSQSLVEALRSDILASPLVAEYSKLFNLYPSTVACYVTNYTTDHCFNYPTNDPQNADLAYQGQINFVANPLVNPPNAYGTVAMEFGPVEGFGQLGAITKFFVYNGRTAAGKRLTAANLDGCGNKSVPELCMNCHGGDWPGDSGQSTNVDNIVDGLNQPGLVLAGIDATDTSPTDAGYLLRQDLISKLTREESGFSSFLPFDTDTYKFPAAASLASQAADIRKLNQIVLYTKPVDPIRDLIKGWYGNNLVSGTFTPWRPTAWDDDIGQPGDESDLHDDVYARACRGCHAAHYSFSSWSSFPWSGRLCDNGSGFAGGSPTMPHAKLTYLNLWKGDFPQTTTFSTLEAWYLATEALPSCN
ncbi:MAG TPA: hypothetical protein VN634_14910 [Candidatus Limnocylindrales bacterium]|nr:hypothetical protein [Candidatus Limnocylindrales bacterium]